MSIRFIPTPVHGVLDYATATLLCVAPTVLGLEDTPKARNIMVGLGLGTVAYSLLTNYELGVKPAKSMRSHLALDAISGIALATSPWTLGFFKRIWLPHLALGLFEILASLLSRKETSRYRRLKYS